MKKVFIFILAVLYLAASTGVMMQRHFCMNRLVGWSLSQQQDDMCSKCGMDKKDNKRCCNDEIIKLKISDDHQSNFTTVHFESPVYPVVHEYMVYEPSILISYRHNYITGQGPPGNFKIPVFIRNNVFRI